jgi:hypothetical protein
MSKSNKGLPPGRVTVPKGDRGGTSTAPSFRPGGAREPDRSQGHGSLGPAGKDQGGNAPGVVRVPSGTQGSHPPNTQSSMSVDRPNTQGHHSYGSRAKTKGAIDGD